MKVFPAELPSGPPWAGLIAFFGLLGWCGAQIAASAQDGDNAAKTGYLIEVAAPLDRETSNQLLVQLTQLADAAPERRASHGGRPLRRRQRRRRETAFEDALKLARAFLQPELRQIRVVSLVEGEITGHTVLPILASDGLLLFGGSAIGNATVGESTSDETILLSYKSIAARRGLFKPAIVDALVDPDAELVLLSEVGGNRIYATGDELKKLRHSGEVLREEILSAAGVPLRLDAKKLREARIAAGVVDSLDQAAELLDLARLNSVQEKQVSGEAKGCCWRSPVRSPPIVSAVGKAICRRRSKPAT